MKRTSIAALVLFLAAGSGLIAKYKIKELVVRPAREYTAHQDFQNIVIGAQPFVTNEEILEIFDTKKLYEKEIMPVLVVIENNNDFAIRVLGRHIYMVDEAGTNIPPLDPGDVLLKITLKKPTSSYSTRKEILLQRAVNVHMLKDFQHKAFGERLIAPQSSDRGVVFFPQPESEDLSGLRLYLPEVENLTTDEQLMFFEFDLRPAQ